MSWGFQIETGRRASFSSGGRLERMWSWFPVVFWIFVSCPSVFLVNSLSSLELIWAGFYLQGWTHSVNTYIVLEFICFSCLHLESMTSLEDTLFLVKAVSTFPGVQCLGLSDELFLVFLSLWLWKSLAFLYWFTLIVMTCIIRRKV